MRNWSRSSIRASSTRGWEDIGADPVGNTPAQMAAQIKDDTERFARLVKDAKVTLE